MNYMHKLQMHREKKNNGRTKSISYTERRNKTDKRYATFATDVRANFNAKNKNKNKNKTKLK